MPVVPDASIALTKRHAAGVRDAFANDPAEIWLVDGAMKLVTSEAKHKFPLIILADSELRCYARGSFYKGGGNEIIGTWSLGELVSITASKTDLRLQFDADVLHFTMVTKANLEKIAQALQRFEPEQSVSTSTPSPLSAKLSQVSPKATGWQQIPELDNRLGFHDGVRWSPFTIAPSSLFVPSILAAQYPPLGYHGGEAVHLCFEPSAGLTIVDSIPHKKLAKWQWAAPRHYWPIEDLLDVEIEVAGKRISQGGAAGHIAGLATAGYSYYGTTKAHDQSWITVSPSDGHSIAFLTEAFHATVLSSQISPFASQIRRTQRHAASEVKPGEPTDLAAQIRALGELRDSGLLTEEEFQAKKTQLLGL